jgi:hypothetical protein
MEAIAMSMFWTRYREARAMTIPSRFDESFGALPLSIFKLVVVVLGVYLA